ncbi:MAG: Flp pilus assembly protein CpaB, partial [Thiomicrorhabdus sp.]|nr:Flp pilus assembly protein CpaB [Thiomicrorhabdus sp.]
LSGSWGILLLALVIGAAAFYMSSAYLANQETSLRERLTGKDEPMTKVVVAIVDVRPGDVLGTHNMAVGAVLSQHVSRYAVSPGQFEYVEGKVVDQYMSRGEPLLFHSIKGGAISRFSELLELGQRAVTLDIDEIASNANMLTAGDFVDIFLLMKMDSLSGPGSGTKKKKSDSERIIVPLLTRTKVIAIGSRSLKTSNQDFLRPLGEEGEQENYGNITLGLAVEEAAKIELAKGMGELVFMLRGAEDTQNNRIDLINETMVVSLGSNIGNLKRYQYYSGSVSVPQLRMIGNDLLMNTDKTWVKSLPLDEHNTVNFNNNKSEALQ